MNKDETKKIHKRSFNGIVVGVSGAKTVKVEVEMIKMHPKYHKQYKEHKSFLVHDENNAAKLGDKVKFVECRPLSKTKRWRITK